MLKCSDSTEGHPVVYVSRQVASNVKAIEYFRTHINCLVFFVIFIIFIGKFSPSNPNLKPSKVMQSLYYSYERRTSRGQQSWTSSSTCCA